ncbi:endo alpha-1,4 polygalactosaminidase [Tenacibaculum sp. nBUS_03]|uniref:endo alpha-1,4 polygalactosaminidase n=1 Tax=Tenacibaculum sp. nBUS_03 TaxID=3395320 RepID=UPI003EBC00D7
MLPFKCFLLLINLFFSRNLSKQSNVFLCYGKVPIYKIINYDYVILEASHYSISEVSVLKKNNKHIICYLSLGEFNKYTSFYNEAKSFKLLGKNEVWDSYYLDLSKKSLQKILLKDIASKIVKKGFDGLFLDNIDNYCTYGKQKHKQKDLLDFLTLIKKKFPSIYLMQNAGLEIIDKTNSLINSIAIESIITNYNFKSKEYFFREKQQSKEKIFQIKAIQKKYNIPFIIIEYTDKTKDKRKIARKLRRYKWNVFIGQIDLQSKPKFK